MSRAVIAVLLGLIVIAPASLAHAGGGMGAGAGVTTCRLVANAPNQPQTIALVDPFVTNNDSTDPNFPGDIVKIKSAALVCELAATGKTVSGPPTGSPILDTVANSIVCYSVTGANSAKADATIQDPFTEAATTAGTQHVAVGAIQFVCVPAVTQ